MLDLENSILFWVVIYCNIMFPHDSDADDAIVGR